MTLAPHQDGLPALPEPYRAVDIYLSHPVLRTVLFVPGDYFTADQMRAYALEAIAAQPLPVQGEEAIRYELIHKESGEVHRTVEPGQPFVMDSWEERECRVREVPVPCNGCGGTGAGGGSEEWCPTCCGTGRAAHPKAQPASPPAGFALVPLRLTRAMDDVLAAGDWAWEDLLAAAESITEQQYEEIISMVPVCKEDANSYSRILTALGMEEEGDPVAAVEKLVAESATAAEINFRAHPASPERKPLTDEQISKGCNYAIELSNEIERAAFRKGVKFAEDAHRIAATQEPRT